MMVRPVEQNTVDFNKLSIVVGDKADLNMFAMVIHLYRYGLFQMVLKLGRLR